MSILVADNFKYQGRKALDNRIIQDTVTDMVALTDSIIYDGIIVYVTTEKKYYTFNSNNTEVGILGKWREFQTGSGNALIEQYAQNITYKKDSLLIYDNEVYLVLTDFISDNTQTTLADSFNLDLTNSKFVAVGKYADSNCIEYTQNTAYKKDTLVYNGEILARVTKDFISDTTSSTTDASFKQDEVNGNIVILNKKQRCIKEYKQGIDYLENDLVYLNGQLAIVFIDYTSNNTEPTVEESFEEDIKNKSLILVGGTGSASIEEYVQNKDYRKDTLVYLNDKLARVIIDYKSDNLKPTVEESFNEDVVNKNLMLIGGNSSASITEDITSNLDVGNIKPNDIIKKDTSLTDFVKKLLIKEILPTGKITAFKSGLNLKGTTVTTPLITAEILTLGDATIDTVEFYRGINLEDTQTYVAGTNVYTFNTTDISSNETISIKIHYTHKDGITKDTLTYSANYTFVNYSYFGLTNGIPTNTDIIGLSSNLKNTKAFTGTVNPVNQHIVYAYPEHLGSLTSIKDQNGFDYIAGSYTNVTMIINGENYKVYYLTSPTTNNNIKQIYA